MYIWSTGRAHLTQIACMNLLSMILSTPLSTCSFAVFVSFISDFNRISATFSRTKKIASVEGQKLYTWTFDHCLMNFRPFTSDYSSAQNCILWATTNILGDHCIYEKILRIIQENSRETTILIKTFAKELRFWMELVYSRGPINTHGYIEYEIKTTCYYTHSICHHLAWHILGDRLIPEQLLWVDHGIIHVGPSKSLTTLAGFSRRVAMLGWRITPSEYRGVNASFSPRKVQVWNRGTDALVGKSEAFKVGPLEPTGGNTYMGPLDFGLEFWLPCFGGFFFKHRQLEVGWNNSTHRGCNPSYQFIRPFIGAP